MQNLDFVTPASLAAELQVVSGEVRPDRLTATGIFRDEGYFLPALLEHYRQIGMEQFLIIDDASTDGSAEMLKAQPDCVVLRSRYRYGQKVRTVLSGRQKVLRAGILLKSAPALRFLQDQWALNLDADEFLILPPGFGSVRELTEWLDSLGAQAVTASLVEFYPRDFWSSGEGAAPPQSFAALLELAPFFDARPVIEVLPTGETKRVYDGPSGRLFAKMGIRGVPKFAARWPRALAGLFTVARADKGPVMKTPLVRWGPGVSLRGSHRASVPSHPGALLACAHFKFTPDLHRRARMARELRSYAGGSVRYDHYVDLLQRMERRSADFMGPASQPYRSAKSLVDAGLMWVER